MSEAVTSGPKIGTPNLYGPFFKEGTDVSYHTAEHLKILKALRVFIETIKSDFKGSFSSVITYNGFVDDTEVTYIRYEGSIIEEVFKDITFTFVLKADKFNEFVDVWSSSGEDFLVTAATWCQATTDSQDMFNRGYRKNISQIAMELPLKWIFPDNIDQPPHLYDDMANGDFQIIDDVVNTFNRRFDRLIGIATKQADKLTKLIKVRDHSLVLVFKANSDFTGLSISLDKVPPKLENGEYNLGEKPINLEDWKQEGNSVLVVVRKVNKTVDHIQSLIGKCRAELPNGAYATGVFNRVLKERLLASTHFMKELYQIAHKDVVSYTEKVANEIVVALNNHGGNIGLDLNTWRVYEYVEGKSPIPLVTEELNFRKSVFDMHTDRFIEILYTYMFHIKSPYIRPYTNKVLANKDDGIAIGSIRHIKEAGDPLAQLPVNIVTSVETVESSEQE